MMASGDQPNGPRFAKAGELDDLTLLPGQFRAFSVEVRDMIERIERKLEILTHMDMVISDLHMRVKDLEKAQRRAEEKRERSEKTRRLRR